MADYIEIDGRQGEGGGQVLRSALSLSVATGRPVRVTDVRGGRRKPGLLRQHLTALRASREISGGSMEGAELGSGDVALWPGPVRAGDYRFGIGSAGSTTLVLQTILPPLLLADGPSTVVLEGGTHNPMAPPFDFLALSFAPLLSRAGGRIDLELVRPGFFPAGGGELRATVHPASRPQPLELDSRGEAGRHHCEIGLAHLHESIAEREWEALRKKLHWSRDRLRIVDMSDSVGPGNAISVRLVFGSVTEVLTAFGEKGVPGPRLASRLAGRTKRFLDGEAPVGEHLADQLMLPLSLLAGGRFRTGELSLHARTNADVINAFLPGAITLEELPGGDGLVTIRSRA